MLSRLVSGWASHPPTRRQPQAKGTSQPARWQRLTAGTPPTHPGPLEPERTASENTWATRTLGQPCHGPPCAPGIPSAGGEPNSQTDPPGPPQASGSQGTCAARGPAFPSTGPGRDANVGLRQEQVSRHQRPGSSPPRPRPAPPANPAAAHRAVGRTGAHFVSAGAPAHLEHAARAAVAVDEAPTLQSKAVTGDARAPGSAGGGAPPFPVAAPKLKPTGGKRPFGNTGAVQAPLRLPPTS